MALKNNPTLEEAREVAINYEKNSKNDNIFTKTVSKNSWANRLKQPSARDIHSQTRNESQLIKHQSRLHQSIC